MSDTLDDGLSKWVNSLETKTSGMSTVDFKNWVDYYG